MIIRTIIVLIISSILQCCAGVSRAASPSHVLDGVTTPARYSGPFREFVLDYTTPKCAEEILDDTTVTYSYHPPGWVNNKELTTYDVGGLIQYFPEGVTPKRRVWINTREHKLWRHMVLRHEALHAIFHCETGDGDSDHSHHLWAEVNNAFE